MEPGESVQLAMHYRLLSGPGHLLRSEINSCRKKDADRRLVGGPQAVAKY